MSHQGLGPCSGRTRKKQRIDDVARWFTVLICGPRVCHAMRGETNAFEPPTATEIFAERPPVMPRAPRVDVGPRICHQPATFVLLQL